MIMIMMKIMMKKMPMAMAMGSVCGALTEDVTLFRCFHVSTPSFSYLKAGGIIIPTLQMRRNEAQGC